MTVELDNEIANQLISRKKIKKFTEGESITVKMDKWTSQNAISLKARRIKSMKPKAKLLAEMKIRDSDAFLDFTLTQLSDLVHVLKASQDDYRGSTATEYYEILGISHLCNKFVETFFERLE